VRLLDSWPSDLNENELLKVSKESNLLCNLPEFGQIAKLEKKYTENLECLPWNKLFEFSTTEKVLSTNDTCEVKLHTDSNAGKKSLILN
jgi:hypothetical protein